MWYLILKLWKSFDNESLLLFLMHRWWRLTLDLKRVNKCLANIKFVLLSVCPVYEALLALTYLTPLSLELFYLFMPSAVCLFVYSPHPAPFPTPVAPLPPPVPQLARLTGQACPVVAPKTPYECQHEGLASTCWSPGVRDTDCPGHGLCCFDGCVNICIAQQAARWFIDKNKHIHS